MSTNNSNTQHVVVNPFDKLNREQLELMWNNPIIPQEVKLQIQGLLALERIITVDAQMVLMKNRIKVLANRAEPVLILGETGTGKELISTALHGTRIGRLVKVNCSGLPDELIESELFGHTKGAFTGAVDNRIGKLEAAKNGTIFLDEIGDMPLNMQAKLLRALQDKIITPLGSNEERKINCRVVSATNKDLHKMQHEGLFRLDLIHRISTFTLRTIPLRERKPDIHELMDALFDPDSKIPPNVRDIIAEMPLFGNVRELEKVCLNYIVFGELLGHEGGTLL